MESEKSYQNKLKLFVVVFSTLTIIVVVFNVFMNPYGYYSDYQFEEKAINNDRIAKYQWIKELEEQPECYSFGSSNSMRISPDSLESITGLKSFNYGMFHATAEDFWSILNALLEADVKRPKLVVFCLDDWNFADKPAPADEVFSGAEKRLAYKPVFAHHLKDYSIMKLYWARFKSALQISQLKVSWSGFFKMITNGSSFERKLTNMTDIFYENGTRIKYGSLNDPDYDLTDTCETGTFEMSEYLREVDSLWKCFPISHTGLMSKSHEDFDNFSQRRLELFYQTILKLEEIDCKVVINIMPNQPFHRDLIVEKTNYLERLENFKLYLSWIESRFKNVICVKDNNDVKNFNGFENHFFDHIHPTSVNSDLMIESFRTELENYAF
ncbi:MAG: hypothetical protein MK105_18610 [Crocinitomicaceae bacterium]|nr:hypothetical protein [Crocinitomicaceae bacterium]